MANESDLPVALVTGASRGIGAAVAAHLSQLGHYVWGTATSEAGAQGISAALAEHAGGGAGLVLRADTPDDCQAAFTAMADGAGLPLIVVNNAGITRDNLLLRMSAQQWQEVMQANLGLLFEVSKAALRPMMKARWGRIVNLSSVVASSGNPGQANYSASKAGIEGFTRSLAQEVASRGITVNAVAPGFISTEMTDELSDDQRAELLKRIPVARMGETADIAAAVAYLVSPAAGYVTGTTLHVNGGMYMS